jgi:hypothetical protein
MECIYRVTSGVWVIRVTEAPPPQDFDARVRQPGLDAIAELVGESPSRIRGGPKRKKVANRREDIPAAAFPPLWTKVLDEMRTSYNGLCAYLSVYLEHAGNRSVDHIVPKSKAWDRVYEWSNYRLANSLVNSRKRETELALDPFAIEDDWFALEFVGYQVKPGIGAVGPILIEVEKTIETLHLNENDFCRLRGEYIEDYLNDDPIPLAYLQRRAPFIARELRRQGKLRPEDV